MKNNTHFFVMENQNENTYHIECRLIVYRAKLGKHPDFLKPTGNSVDGFNTKYFLLIEDDIASKTDADKRCDELERDYGEIIINAEDTGNWDKFPFKDKLIVYYK